MKRRSVVGRRRGGEEEGWGGESVNRLGMGSLDNCGLGSFQNQSGNEVRHEDKGGSVPR